LDRLGGGTKQLASGVGLMGTVALLLAALGLASVLAFVVEQRWYEIGVRMALGAQAGNVTWMVLRQSMVLAGIGLLVGTLVAAGAATGLRGVLFGLPPIDPIAFGGSTLVILVVAALASAGPARRASRVDPMVALRAE
jgi:putative ABC transport system permease protein